MENEHFEQMNTARLMTFILEHTNEIRVEKTFERIPYNVSALTDTGCEGMFGGGIHAATVALAKHIRDKHEAEKLRARIETMDGALKYIREKTGQCVTITVHDEWHFDVAFIAFNDTKHANGITAEEAVVKLAKKIMEETK